MNFMSYMAEVSRGWDEPNARDMGRMTSQPNAKGEMYILNDGIDMKAKIAAMARRLEKLEMTNMQPVQAISQTPLQAMLCAICLSYEHLVEECPAISAEREMFRDQANVVGQFKPNNNAPYGNTYNSSWRNHPNFSWKARATQYQQPDQPSQQSSSLEQAIANLSKVVGDFVGNQEAINAQLSQRIDRVESTLNKRMDVMQNNISQKFDNLQYSISRLTNLNTQEKENSSSQPYQNSMSIHEMEAQEENLQWSGKEVDLPTCKLEHKVESETEKEKREERKGKKREKTTEDSHQGRDDEETHASIFPQALYGKILQSKFWMISSRRKCKEIERKSFESNGAITEQNMAKKGLRDLQPLQNQHFAKPVQALGPLCENFRMKPILAHDLGSQESRASNGFPHFKLRYSCEITFELRNHFLAHESHFEAPYTHFVAAK
ncbi:hypothetical protein AAG906_016098 [Vitis piasezkii]